jgi:hypothetical protein
MDLATFPVDCQNLQICLKPYKLEVEKVRLRPRREESAIEHQDSHEWKVSVTEADLCGQDDFIRETWLRS